MLSRIQSEPGVSRAELARGFSFSEMAATRIARELIAAGIIEEFSVDDADKGKKRTIGRPSIGLRINPHSLFAAGITVSAYHSEVSICDANGKLFASRQVANTSFDSIPDNARLYAEALRALIADSDVKPDRIVGVGVALSADTIPDRQEIARSEYFGWGNDSGAFCDIVSRITELPVEIENIANALALSEMRFGVARGLSEFALVHVATFAGVGAVSENRLIRGRAGSSGQIGHLRAARRPLNCVCGRHDCLNLSATGFAVLAELGVLDHESFDRAKLPYYAESLLAAIGDPRNADHLEAAGAQLAPAVDAVSRLLGSEQIILSGYLGAHDAYFRGVVKTLARSFDYGENGRVRLVKGEISPIEAASLLALHTFCYSDRLDYERFSRQNQPDPEESAYA